MHVQSCIVYVLGDAEVSSAWSRRVRNVFHLRERVLNVTYRLAAVGFSSGTATAVESDRLGRRADDNDDVVRPPPQHYNTH